MLRDAAINWVRTNCPNRKLSWDVKEALDAAAAEGVNCWFAIGSGTTRSKVPFLLHCFSNEVFIFQLTAAQAAGMGLKANGMGCGRDRAAGFVPPAPPPTVSLEQLEVTNASFTQATPIGGRLHYEVLADGPRSWCVRLDYELPGGGRRIAWSYPEQPLHGRGTCSSCPSHPAPMWRQTLRGLWCCSPGCSRCRRRSRPTPAARSAHPARRW